MKRIGRYFIRSEIARGGMASVWRAYDPRFKREVAVKLLPREFLYDASFRARFQREAQTIAALEHEAIVPVHDSGEQEGQPYLVMRLMGGGSLAQRIAQGPLSLQEAAGVLVRLSAGLDYAHSKGIVHRDLKPGNVLFDQFGYAHLSDFGIAHWAEATVSLTVSGAIIGTPAYMSPEQVQGDAELDLRSDVYSLGVILFEMLTGQQPFQANTPTKVMMKHLLDPVPHIRERNPTLPLSADQVVAAAMAKQPPLRYPSAGALAQAFLALVDSARPLAVPPTPGALPGATLPGAAPSAAEPRPFPAPGAAPARWNERLAGLPGWSWIAGSLLGLGALAGLVGGGVLAVRALLRPVSEPATSQTPGPAALVGPIGSPSPTRTRSPSATTPTATPTPAQLLLSVQEDAACRAGPGLGYDVLGYLTPGLVAWAHGRDAEASWWWIDFPDGSRTCWISRLVVAPVEGGLALPVLTPGPTSTPAPTSTEPPAPPPRPPTNTPQPPTDTPEPPTDTPFPEETEQEFLTPAF